MACLLSCASVVFELRHRWHMLAETINHDRFSMFDATRARGAIHGPDLRHSRHARRQSPTPRQAPPVCWRAARQCARKLAAVTTAPVISVSVDTQFKMECSSPHVSIKPSPVAQSVLLATSHARPRTHATHKNCLLSRRVHLKRPAVSAPSDVGPKKRRRGIALTRPTTTTHTTQPHGVCRHPTRLGSFAMKD